MQQPADATVHFNNRAFMLVHRNHLRSTTSKSSRHLFVFLCTIVIICHQFRLIASAINDQEHPLQPDLTDPDASCNEFHKDCHCGSIAQSPGTALFTRVVYPNSTSVIEEYDEDVPYGYKYLRVFYRCMDDENVMVGNNMRECSAGNWIGQVPRCAFNLQNGTKLRQVKISDYKSQFTNRAFSSNDTSSQFTIEPEKPLSATTLYYDPNLKQAPTGAFEIPLNRQPAECLRWSLFPKQVWSLTLSKPTRIHYVRIKLYGDKIEDLKLNKELSFSMQLKNITYFKQQEHYNRSPSTHASQKQEHVIPIDIKCQETFPKVSQYVQDTYQQKYSANYLVLDFLCELENHQKSVFEYFFSYDYEVDQLYASAIEIKFSMQLPIGQEEAMQRLSNSAELPFKPNIFVTSLCELKLYAFKSDCGTPDIPVSAIVQRDFNFLDETDGKKTFKYICNDKNQELKGNSYVECGNYGQWKNEFPQCVRIRPCRLLNNESNSPDYVLAVKYESTMTTKTGVQVVPNGKYARFSCIKRHSTYEANNTVHITQSAPSSPANQKSSALKSGPSSTGGGSTTQVICRNGRWIGLEAINSECISRQKKSNSTLNDPSVQLVSLPVRLIRILFALFIILCLIIVSLLVYMFIFRQQMTQAVAAQNSLKDQYIGLNHFDLNSNLIPTILYNDINGGPDDCRSAIYQTADSNLYERISLDQHGDNLYQTIKMTGDNYSDVSSIFPPSIGAHEERENSIYGMDVDDIRNSSASAADLRSLRSASSQTQLTLDKNYNQLDRSSSMFMKNNSIYEME